MREEGVLAILTTYSADEAGLCVWDSSSEEFHHVSCQTVFYMFEHHG
jgi:hypothetical protein